MEGLKRECTIKIIEPDEKANNYVDPWKSFISKDKRKSLGICKPPFPHPYKTYNKRKNGLGVEEMKSENNSKRIQDLGRQLTAYLDQVLEQNRMIQKLQERLREEESKGVESVEKVRLTNQQATALENRLKSAECRARAAEHRAEAMKQRNRALSISCKHQGVQLKDLAKNIEYFTKNLDARTLIALESGRTLEHQTLHSFAHERKQQRQIENPRIEDHSIPSSLSEANPVVFNNHCTYSEVAASCRASTPDLNSPSTNCFKYHTITTQELKDKYVVLLCKRSSTNNDQHTPRLDQKQDTLSSKRVFGNFGKAKTSVPSSSAHKILTMKELVQRAPKWQEDSHSPIQIEQLIHKCIFQALKLKDLSRDLDCFPKKVKKEAAASISSLSTSSSRSKGNKVRFVEDDVTPSPVSTTLSEVFGDPEGVSCKHESFIEQTNRCLERYLFNLSDAAESLQALKKVPRFDVWIQTIPVSEWPTLTQTEALTLSKSSHRKSRSRQRHRHLAFNDWSSDRTGFELKAWRFAFISLIQTLLLWIGFHFIPEMTSIQYLPPPT